MGRSYVVGEREDFGEGGDGEGEGLVVPRLQKLLSLTDEDVLIHPKAQTSLHILISEQVIYDTERK